MPDALSKTVPIWCSVLNRALFPEDPSSHRLFVPPNVVSPSEASQIEARLPDFVASFLALAIDPQPLRRQLGDRPLRPLWVTQEDRLGFLEHYDSGVSAGAGADSAAAAGGGNGDGPGEVVAGRLKPFPFHPVVCCTSSKRVLGVGAEIGEAGGYIQGAGDDTENWALGLTAEVFWRHKEELLAASEAELPELITQLVAAGSNADPGGKEAAGRELKRVAPGIFIGTLGARERALSDSAGPCVVTLVPRSTEQSSWVKSPTHMEVGLGKNKAASRLLRDALPQICGFVSRFLEKRLGNGAGISLEKSVIVLCESGKDLSVGVALALYCWCFDAAGNARSVDDRASFNKTAIRVKLGHIMTEMPNANPSRATLQSVNSFLMDWRK
jgi:tRNA A64-2'-O-ribosylphosphate transferase